MGGFCPLASGSKGNAIFLETEKTKILLDAGISFKQLTARLAEIGQSLEAIDAILISHEHSDHIAALASIANAREIPILVNAETAKGIYRVFHEEFDFRIFTTGETFAFEDLVIDPFTVQHDTLDPVGFVIMAPEAKIGFCTDLGMVTSLVKKKLQGCDVLYIEANHDVEMVHGSSRPDTYKQRVLGRQGHLSNEETALLLKEIYHPGLKRVYLAHMSSECNHPEAALKTIRGILQKEVTLSIAYQDKVSDFVNF